MNYVTEENKLQIKQINIVDYALTRGIKLVETSKNKAYKIAGEHLQGMYLYNNSNGFYRFSTNEKGNIIDFVKLYDGCSYIEACNKLLDFLGRTEIQNYNISNKINREQENEKEKTITMPKADVDCKEAINYLNNIRGINLHLINKLIKLNKIKQFTINNNKYVGFVGYDNDNEEKYLSLRSIKPTYNHQYDKYDYKNSNKKYAFKVENVVNEKEKININLFEAPIDLISFINLYRAKDNTIYLCAGGLNNKSINEVIKKYNNKIDYVNICFDNDEPGNKYADILAKELIEKGIKVSRIKANIKISMRTCKKYDKKIMQKVSCDST